MVTFILFIPFNPSSQGRNKQLSSANERMEMELLYSRAIDMNGGLGDSDDGGAGTEKGSSILRQKYERAAKDLEYAKKRLAQQHEDDMEQLMALKKQLEKKVHNLIFLSEGLLSNNEVYKIMKKICPIPTCPQLISDLCS